MFGKLAYLFFYYIISIYIKSYLTLKYIYIIFPKNILKNPSIHCNFIQKHYFYSSPFAITSTYGKINSLLLPLTTLMPINIGITTLRKIYYLFLHFDFLSFLLIILVSKLYCSRNQKIDFHEY